MTATGRDGGDDTSSAIYLRATRIMFLTARGDIRGGRGRARCRGGARDRRHRPGRPGVPSAGHGRGSPRGGAARRCSARRRGSLGRVRRQRRGLARRPAARARADRRGRPRRPRSRLPATRRRWRRRRPRPRRLVDQARSLAASGPTGATPTPSVDGGGRNRRGRTNATRRPIGRRLPGWPRRKPGTWSRCRSPRPRLGPAPAEAILLARGPRDEAARLLREAHVAASALGAATAADRDRGRRVEVPDSAGGARVGCRGSAAEPAAATPSRCRPGQDPRPVGPRVGGPRARRGRSVERGDRRVAVHQPEDRERPRHPHPRQAGREQPGRGGDDRGPGHRGQRPGPDRRSVGAEGISQNTLDRSLRHVGVIPERQQVLRPLVPFAAVIGFVGMLLAVRGDASRSCRRVTASSTSPGRTPYRPRPGCRVA